ncbi:MAG: hypothetical protein KA521_00230 [Crocinitomicaceae bacterium]|nr:hypothetical protein [Crocinitomicaceae bacterium]
MTNLFKRSFIVVIIALIGVSFSSGCRKKEDTIARIYVRDETNALVPLAKVVLYGKSTTNQPSNISLYDTAYTNLSGAADFNFNDVYQLGQAGVAVLDISASSNNKSGKGIIKVEQEVTSTETVFIQ